MDQGSQFTREAFTAVLLQHGVQISMDGKGRCMDNIFVERLWRSVNYEEVYLKAFQNGPEAKAGIGAYLRLYNEERPHQALDYQTPRQVFEAGCHLADVVAANRPATGQEPERRCSPNREVVSWSRLGSLPLVMTTSNTAEDPLNLATSLS